MGAVARLSHCPGGDKEGLERDPRNQEHLAGARGLAMTLCGGPEKRGPGVTPRMRHLPGSFGPSEPLPHTTGTREHA